LLKTNIFIVDVIVGRTLADREKVTAQIVANWFANKRKELKKMAKDGKLSHVHTDSNSLY
jgi:hypothetical protein